jgi:predicted glycosyltransferase
MTDDGVKFETLTHPRSGLIGRATELAEHNLKVWYRLITRKIDVALGASVSVAQGAYFAPTKSVVFNDDDADVVPEFVKLGYPFADWVVTPDCLNENHGKHHVLHPSYHTLSYLHPDHFTPDPKVLDQIGLKPGDPFFILRFVALNAFHDTGAQGLTFEDKVSLINTLKEKGRVLISCEGSFPAEFESYRIKLKINQLHSLMAFATMLVSDSQTMTSEAAVLGVPSLRCNSFVGRISYLEELEHKYQLTKGFKPHQRDQLFAQMNLWLADPNLKKIWQDRRAAMLKEKINLADWIYNFVQEKFL